MSIPAPDDSGRRPHKKRPDSVAKLGLSLPVSQADVKQAYFEKARETHPDHGGQVSDFLEVQRAFDEAVAFAERNGKRLPWIGAQMPVYLAQVAAIELVERLGGSCQLEHLDWLAGTVGEDFALLADRLKGVDLSGSGATDADMQEFTDDAAHLPFLETLDLSNTPIGDDAAMRLSRLPGLKRLDLRGTKVSYGMRRRLAKQPRMEHVEGVTRFGGWFGGG